MTEIRCDFDGPFPEDFFFRVRVLTRHQGWRVDRIMIRKTKHGWHAVVYIHARVSALGIVTAQAILGSDWQRENFNLYRARHWRDMPAEWREARRWNALYTSHVHFSWSVADATSQPTGTRRKRTAGKPV